MIVANSRLFKVDEMLAQTVLFSNIKGMKFFFQKRSYYHVYLTNSCSRSLFYAPFYKGMITERFSILTRNKILTD